MGLGELQSDLSKELKQLGIFFLQSGAQALVQIFLIKQIIDLLVSFFVLIFSKGQLPFSTEWFLTWQPNIHASLFQNTYQYLSKVSALEDIDAIMKAYKLYTEQIAACGVEPLLSITRAWRLVKFIDNQMLSMTKCSKCGGHFVSEAYENSRHFECGLCSPPARAGKGAAAGGIQLH